MNVAVPKQQYMLAGIVYIVSIAMEGSFMIAA
jgi:hypothetical protein